MSNVWVNKSINSLGVSIFLRLVATGFKRLITLATFASSLSEGVAGF